MPTAQGNRVLLGFRRDARQHPQQIVPVPPRLLALVGDPELARGPDLQQIDSQLAQGGQIRGQVLRTMLGIVLMEDYVQHVVQTILDAPV